MPEEIPTHLGALEDTRSEELKQKDIHLAEVVTSAAAVNWVEKPEAQWRKFLMQNQDGSSSCVAQTIKKLGSINLFLKQGNLAEFSATPIYAARSNRPGEGMIGVEAFDLWRTLGLTFEVLVPSTNMNDSAIDNTTIEQYKKDVGKVFLLANHVGLPQQDIETVASTIQQTGKGVMVWFWFSSAEWSKLTPTLDTGTSFNGALKHSVAAVDFTLVNGKKCLIIEDSAHFGGLNRRIITEDFFKARNWFARYPTTFKFDDGTTPQPLPPSPIPHHTFVQNLAFIPWNAALNQPGDLALNQAQTVDVMKLQDILRYEGFFPVNTQSTGYYGALTAKAVYQFQVKHNVAPLAELDSIVPKGGRVGAKTIAMLNTIYG